MTWIDDRWRAARRVFRLPATKTRLEAELDDELRFHLDGRIEDLMAREGLSRDAAEREAVRRFGDVGAYRRATRVIDDHMFDRRRRLDVVDAIRRETRHAARSLARTPSFSFIVVLTLALGLGAATTIFTLLDRVVLRPLPYPNADRLIHIGSLWPKGFPGQEYSISRGQYFYFRANSGVLADLMLYDEGTLAVAGDAAHPAERVSSIQLSHTSFDILGIRPALGRLIRVEDEAPEVPSVAVLSNEYWQRRFGGDPRIVGQRMDIAGLTVQIVGVLAPRAHVLDDAPEVWLPNHLDPSAPPVPNHTHRAIGLLKPGISVEAAAADIKRLQDRFAADNPKTYSKSFIDRTGFAMHVTSLRDHAIGGAVARGLWLLFVAVALVLVIAAANVANLFLVRIDARRREVAVRTALGAGRAQLAVYYLSESLLLALAASVAAVLLGDGLLKIAIMIAPQTLPRLAEVSLGARSVAFCVMTSIAFGFVFGIIPLASAKMDVATLRDASRGLTASRPRELARRALVLSQVTLAVVLLAGAAVVTKSFARLARVQPGFDPVGVLSMDVILPDMRYRTYREAAPFWHELIRRVEALPGVVRAGATGELPLADGFGCTGILTDVIGADGNAQGNCMPLSSVTPGYFETMGIKLRGASPTWSDVEAGTGSVVVSRAFAKRFWGATDPVGHTVKPLSTNLPEFPIVAEAADIRGRGLQEPPVEVAYLPLVPRTGTRYWEGSRSMTLVVRAPSVNPTTLVASIRAIVADIDPQVPIAGVESMERVVAKSVAQRSFTMLLLLIAAGVALVLSAVGIYGVISYLVGQRRGEIGIRIALGAQGAQISRLVIGHALLLAGAGAVFGIAAAAATTRLLSSLLYDVSPNDPLSLAIAGALLIGVALLASVGPTRRAMRVDPVEAMR